MAKTLSIYAIQMTSGSNMDDNLRWVEAEISKAPDKTDIVILPEMFALFGVSDQRPLAQQERSFQGPVGSKIRQLAKKYKVWIVAGSVPVMDDLDSKPRARCHVIDGQGELVTYYDKIHLFDAVVDDPQGRYQESDSYSAGDQAVCFDSPWGRIGLTICYDLRFPELYRHLNDQGATLIMVPAAFTKATGEAHWEVLCRARAIENGLYLAAVNQCGRHDAKRETWGHSMIVSPWGEVQTLLDQTESKLFTIDLDAVNHARNKLPVNLHRRAFSN